MLHGTRDAHSFGAHDRPPCVNCGNQTFLTRRSPAAAYAFQLERQTFTCLECDLDFERVVDAQGKPVARFSVAELTRAIRAHRSFIWLTLSQLGQRADLAIARSGRAAKSSVLAT
jgi:hypothetical protein